MDFKFYQTPESIKQLDRLREILQEKSRSATIRVAVADRLEQEEKKGDE